MFGPVDPVWRLGTVFEGPLIPFVSAILTQFLAMAAVTMVCTMVVARLGLGYWGITALADLRGSGRHLLHDPAAAAANVAHQGPGVVQKRARRRCLDLSVRGPACHAGDRTRGSHLDPSDRQYGVLKRRSRLSF